MKIKYYKKTKKNKYSFRVWRPTDFLKHTHGGVGVGGGDTASTYLGSYSTSNSTCFGSDNVGTHSGASGQSSGPSPKRWIAWFWNGLSWGYSLWGTVFHPGPAVCLAQLRSHINFLTFSFAGNATGPWLDPDDRERRGGFYSVNLVSQTWSNA